ncbi:MAG: GNAT family N-acetyltransferase [Kiloniellales bacterium]|nr:GNAT family N-acetyltransferase [Kiloniellales bacterium]
MSGPVASGPAVRALVLRPARPDDAAAILAMLRALAEDVGEAEAFAAGLADVRRDAFGPAPRYECLLAERDGRPVGLLTHFATYSTYKGRACLHVNDLYVAPEARGLGVGRRLMGRACRLALERNCCRVELKVLETNTARDFYESIGMGATAERAYTIADAALTELAGADRSGPARTGMSEAE